MPEPYELDWVRLPLEAAHNVRELGGYPVSGGGQTRYHRFLRSDGLSGLTDSDRDFLCGYGVRLVLDLRDPTEVDELPDAPLGEGVTSLNVPLLAFDISSREEVERRFRKRRPTYEDFYDMILSNHAGLRRCFAAIAKAPAGCVLFHCAVGKDRTGILALLLMALAGCDKWDCVGNYVQTRTNLMRHEWFVSAWNYPSPTQVLNDSPAHAMEHAWGVVEGHGGARAFLLSCGVTEDQIVAARDRILE